MAFCSNCGSPVEGRFCSSCGTAITAAEAGAASAPLADNVASALCYVLGFVTGILFLILSPYNQNRTVRFHAFQAIFLHVAAIAVYIVAGIVFGVLRYAGVLPFLWPLIVLAMFATWIYLIVSAYQGKRVVLPVVGPLAEQQANSR